MKTNKMIKWAACGASLMMMVTVSAWAAPYYWNVNGNGDWDTTSAAWATAKGGGTPIIVTTGSADDIYFSADNITAGTVTVIGNQLANNLYLDQAFNITSGTIFLNAGGNGLVRVGASGTISSFLAYKGVQFTQLNQTLTLTGGGTTQNAYNVTGFTTDIAKTSTLLLQSGTYMTSQMQNNINIGNMAGSGTGGLVVGGSATYVFAGSQFLLVSGNGLVRLSGGFINFSSSGNNNTLDVGYGSAGRFIMDSGTIKNVSTNDLVVGSGNGSGIFDMNGGEITVTQGLSIQATTNNAATASVMNINGGVTNVKQVTFGKTSSGFLSGDAASSAGSGTLNVKGGRLNIGNGGIVNSGSSGSGFTYAVNLSGGTISNSGTGWSSALNMNLSKTNGGVTFDVVGGSNDKITLSGVLSGSGGLTKAGGGTLLLKGANTYTGNTIVSNGILSLDGGELTFSLAENTQLSLGINGGALLNGHIAIDTAGVSSDGSWQIISSDAANLSNLFYGGNFSINGWNQDSQELTKWKLGDFIFDQTTGWVTTVPEPSTFGLLAVGAALMVGVRLLRKRQ